MKNKAKLTNKTREQRGEARDNERHHKLEREDDDITYHDNVLRKKKTWWLGSMLTHNSVM